MNLAGIFLLTYAGLIAFAVVVWHFEKRRQRRVRLHESPDALRLRRTFHVQ